MPDVGKCLLTRTTYEPVGILARADKREWLFEGAHTQFAREEPWRHHRCSSLHERGSHFRRLSAQIAHSNRRTFLVVKTCLLQPIQPPAPPAEQRNAQQIARGGEAPLLNQLRRTNNRIVTRE